MSRELDEILQTLELAFRWIARLPDGRDPTTATCAYVPADVYEQIAEALEADREDDRDKWLHQRWSYENRAEVAERGHKAALARDFKQRDEIKALRAALEMIYTKSRDRHAAAVAWEALQRWQTR